MNYYVVNFFSQSVNYGELIKSQSLTSTSKNGQNFVKKAKKSRK